MPEQSNEVTSTEVSLSPAIRFLILIGNSGAGKSVLGNNLVIQRPDLFNKTIQTTTRAQRVGTYDPYVFMDKEQYDTIKHHLIGKTTVTDGTGITTFYGTFIPAQSDKINIIVLNEAGLDDFLEWADERDNVKHSILGLVNTNFSWVRQLPGRAYRDERFLANEVQFAREMSELVLNTSIEYPKIQDVVDFCVHEILFNE